MDGGGQSTSKSTFPPTTPPSFTHLTSHKPNNSNEFRFFYKFCIVTYLTNKFYYIYLNKTHHITKDFYKDNCLKTLIHQRNSKNYIFVMIWRKTNDISNLQNVKSLGVVLLYGYSAVLT